MMDKKQALIFLEAMRRTYGLFVHNPEEYTKAISMGMDALEKQIPKPPVPDENATDRFGKLVPRCQVCGYAMDLRMEQYCPNCGQRLTGYEEE